MSQVLNSTLVLDPRISYTALKDKFNDDPALAADLEASKSKLETYFKDNYMPQWPIPLSAMASTSSICSDSSAPTSSSKSPQKNFTARFNQWKCTPSDKLMEFWHLPHEDFDTCNPLRWWHGRHSQFPNLSWLAHDIFSIPGKSLKLFMFHSSK